MLNKFIQSKLNAFEYLEEDLKRHLTQWHAIIFYAPKCWKFYLLVIGH